MSAGFPMLKNAEESQLWCEYFSDEINPNRKKQIRDKIITSHLRLALKIAKKWQKSGIPLSELFSESQTGLVYAFDKFSPGNGATFATYASYWILASVSLYVQNNSSSLKTGTSQFQKYLFFNYNKLKKALIIENQHLSDDDIDRLIAHKVISSGISSYDFDKTLSEIRVFHVGRSRISSLNTPLSDDSDSSSYIDLIADPNAQPVIDKIIEKEETSLGSDFLVMAYKEFVKNGVAAHSS
jgi:RNA polymerase sigma-32 factor